MTMAAETDADEGESVGADDASGGRVRVTRRSAGEDREVVETTADDRYTRKKCALITGCSSGIGRATARAFLAADWRVFATSRDPEDVADLAEAGCETLALDVTDPDQVARAIETAVDEGGALDCLVNNAGYARMGPVEDVSTVDLHRQFDVNVYGPHRLTRAALPHMRAAGEGRIVTVSSVLGRLSVAGTGAYAGTKHAVEAMNDALRAEVEEFGVDVVLIEPGTVETDFVDRVEEELPGDGDRTAAYESLYEIVEDAGLVGGDGPLAVDPEDVATAIVDAATCADPPARYPVGPVAQYGLYARFLPDRVRDAAYGLVRKLV